MPLPAIDLAPLVDRYRADVARWKALPRRGEVRGEQLDFAETFERAVRKADRLHPMTAGLLFDSVDERHGLCDPLQDLVARARIERDRIPARGGRDRAGQDGPPPRFRLVLALARLVAEHHDPSAVTSSSTGLLYDLALDALTLAGDVEPTVGLHETVKEAVAAWKNQTQQTAVSSPDLVEHAAYGADLRTASRVDRWSTLDRQ